MASSHLEDDFILRWDAADPKYLPLLSEGGITAVLTPDLPAGFRESCARAGISVEEAGNLAFASLEEIGHAGSDAPVVLDHGLWPGAGQPPSVAGGDHAVAGASAQPWIDANMHWFSWLRALYPGRPAVLGYLPNRKAGLPEDRLVPYETLELALIEARMSGGNYVLALETRYRDALLKGESKARNAWRGLGRTARWLRENAQYLRQPALPVITGLADPGEETAEIANLLFRQNASPALAALSSPPRPDPRRIRALVAVNLHNGTPASGPRILAHANSGSTVVLDDGDTAGWWRSSAGGRLREEHDREFYELGQGRLVVYKERILDPSEFALDVIDLVTHPRRAVRLWGTSTVIGVLKIPPADHADGKTATLTLVNYGLRVQRDILARVQGKFHSASLLRPEAGPLELETAIRGGSTTEILLPEIQKTAIVLFR